MLKTLKLSGEIKFCKFTLSEESSKCNNEKSAEDFQPKVNYSTM